MAKGRKPAIDGLARPQGLLDDVVYPVAQKAARKVANKFSVAKRARPSATAYNIHKKAAALEDEMAIRRFKSYSQKAKTAKTRRGRVLASKKAGAAYYGDSVRNAKKAEIYQNKGNYYWLRASDAKSDSEAKRMLKRSNKFIAKAEKRSAR